MSVMGYASVRGPANEVTRPRETEHGQARRTPRPTTTANPPALKIGSRVRCTDDGVEGRITWANARLVKIKWDDGEQVTWSRDSLATRPIEILDAEDENDQSAAPAVAAAAEPPATTEQPRNRTGGHAVPQRSSPRPSRRRT